jgi:S1-C subfamily serine protease
MPKGELISSGSGFSVSASEIATAYHVVADSKSIEVRFGDGDWISAKLVKESESTDIAILEIDEERSNYLPPIVEHETLPGDRIFTMGFPAVEILGTEAKYTEGVVSSLSGLGNDSCLLQITVPIQPGSSGGPLVREDGVLVGMVTSTAAFLHFAAVTAALPQNVNWGVKADYISLLMTEKAKKRTTGDRRAILEVANDSVCRIRAK